MSQLGNFLESYADCLELNVWTSSKILKATRNDSENTWTVDIQKGSDRRTLNVAHLVFATGFGGGNANIPQIPGKVGAIKNTLSVRL